MKPEYEQILAKARAKEKEILKQMLHLSKFKRNGFDQTVEKYSEAAFSRIDCLECGACCRAIGPRFRDKDIKVMAKQIGLAPKEFADRYLKPDIDEDFSVLASLPCPFLNDDNTCEHYDDKPLSCEEFPYTTTKNVQRHLVRLGHSAMFCPAAALIAQRVIEEY
jgi:uncharacterized protein